jgi:prevent-host-death family protein
MRDVMTDPDPYPPAAVVPMGEARSRLAALVDLVGRTRSPVALTRNGRPAAVLVDAEEWALVSRLADAMEAITAEHQAAEAEAASDGTAVPLAEILADLAADEAAEQRRAG